MKHSVAQAYCIRLAAAGLDGAGGTYSIAVEVPWGSTGETD